MKNAPRYMNKNFKFNKAYRNVMYIIFFVCILYACQKNDTRLFQYISPSQSGISFNNLIYENDTINPIDEEFMYQGGGVAVADFNNDGLMDIYFTGNMVSNSLYLNEGNLRFKDVTQESNTGCDSIWCSGVSVVDINADGKMDIYVCRLLRWGTGYQTNILLINIGNNEAGVPIFEEKTKEYGLADTSFSMQANFFDHDKDGDLDMFLLISKKVQRDAHHYSTGFNNNTGDTTATDADRLYRNDWNDSLGHPVFTMVGKESGIYHRGYGLGCITADFNGDQWPDIYVANDFIGNDQLFVNQKDGTFSEELSKYFKHTSLNAMGTDFADINNDGLPDLITVDMDPFDNFRKKKNTSGNNYFLYQNFKQGNYMHQVVRNTLQLNQGAIPGATQYTYAEIGFMAGVAETDWSWNPGIIDLDNDGFRDIFITNGYPRDVTDHDFGMFKIQKYGKASKQDLIDNIPSIKVHNFAFRNINGLTFENVTQSWGFESPNFSNGAVFADLDNDGDLDIVINHINDIASVYENTINHQKTTNKNYISIDLLGTRLNPKGIGTYVTVYAGQKVQAYENSPFRGYMSTQSTRIFFGLDTISTIDSLLIKWPDGLCQTIYNPAINQTLEVKYAPDACGSQPQHLSPFFTQIIGSKGIEYRHEEADFIDFNVQRLLPHKLSQYGPPVAVGDLNGDGWEDVVVGGTGDFEAHIFFQKKDGTFEKTILPHDTGSQARRPEHSALFIFDADSDGWPDIYIATGSNEWAKGTPTYRDLLLINDGKGRFTISRTALPAIFSSNSCVKGIDYDNDGDIDLFIGGRSLPGEYPKAVDSYILRNDSKPGSPKFTEVSNEIAPMLKNIGMVTDAVWTDFDQDGQWDLILTLEWESIKILRQFNGKFENATPQSGIAHLKGWWNSVTAADLDNDGDTDYVVGNLGLNSYYRASAEYPVKMYGADFDNNGLFDAVPGIYLPDEKGVRREYPAHVRDELVDQLPFLKKQFLYYKDFGKATLAEILPFTAGPNVLVLEANTLANGWLRNEGGGRFTFIPFDFMGQIAPMFAVQVADINQDGYNDIIAVGNDHGMEVRLGHHDASNGWVMLGSKKGQFHALRPGQSGWFVPGNGKGLAWIQKTDKSMQMIATQNQDSVRNFKLTALCSWHSLPHINYTHLIFHQSGGRMTRVEAHQQVSFASQSSTAIPIPGSTEKIDIYKGKILVDTKFIDKH